MEISYEEKGSKFIIKCKPSENHVVMGMPERRFRKATGVWAAPALRNNVQYMAQHMNNPSMYTREALEQYNLRRQPLAVAPQGEKAFPAWYKFKKFQPLKHQIRAFNKFFPLDIMALFFEQGLGKTYTSINLAAAWRMTNQIDAAVIVCPTSIKLVWEEELSIHCPIPYQVHSLEAGKYKAADKFIQNKTDFQWFIVGIEALSQGNAHEYLQRFLQGRKCFFGIDESSRIKTPNKIRTDKCVSLGKYAKKRAILSGTSITKGLEDLYTQFKFLDGNIIGYDSYYTYRAYFCVMISMVVGYDNHGNEKTTQKIVGYKNENELIDLLSPYTERVEKKDALDLPEKIFTNRYLTMNPEQKRIYEEMKHELFIEIDGTSYEVKTVLEKFLRLQQITGGHYPWDDGTSIIPTPIPGKNPKLEELMELMEEIDGKVVIWCQFRCEITLVAEALAKAEIETVQFHGGCDDTEKKFAVHHFRYGSARVFLATRAAAYGLTLIESSTSIYYSQGYSLEEYLQSQDRIHRIGQHTSTNYVHLLCDKTIDINIIKALASKQSIADMIYSVMKEYQ